MSKIFQKLYEIVVKCKNSNPDFDSLVTKTISIGGKVSKLWVINGYLLKSGTKFSIMHIDRLIFWKWKGKKTSSKLVTNISHKSHDILFSDN